MSVLDWLPASALPEHYYSVGTEAIDGGGDRVKEVANQARVARQLDEAAGREQYRAAVHTARTYRQRGRYRQALAALDEAADIGWAKGLMAAGAAGSREDGLQRWLNEVAMADGKDPPRESLAMGGVVRQWWDIRSQSRVLEWNCQAGENEELAGKN